MPEMKIKLFNELGSWFIIPPKKNKMKKSQPCNEQSWVLSVLYILEPSTIYA